MNRRALVIAGIILILLAAGGVAAWYFFGGSSEEQLPTPTPTVSPDLPGTLPSSSIEPTNSFVIPSASPTPAAPLAFSGVCPDTWATGQDTDGDTLPDSVEAIYGTDENASDTDNDGYNDGQEVRAGYDPLNAVSSVRLDSDHDGLFDNEECVWGTDVFDPDSDGDGFQDGSEVENGYDPAKKGDGNGSDKLSLPQQATPIPNVPGTGQQGGAFATPTPVSTPPILSQAPAEVVLVPFSQLRITSSTAPADVRTYLTEIDALRPQELSDGTAITNAIQSAATGNVAALSQVRTRIQQFAASLKGVATPTPAQEYHQLYVSLIDFTAARLQTIEQHATGDQQRAAQAVLDIQNTLPSYVNQLTSLRGQVEGVANQQ